MESVRADDPHASAADLRDSGRESKRDHERDLPPAAARALLRIGGERLIRHQLGLALAAGCQRIICVVRGFGPEMADLQRDAEQGGASFHIVAGAAGLSGLITAADEVLIIAEGLMATTGDALRLLDGGQAILIQPAEAGVPAGFERIDLNHASAGLMLIPGRLVDRLMDLPPDADPASALLRIALQAGVPQRAIADEVRLGGRWLLIRSEGEAQAAEDGWMNRHTALSARTPGTLAARVLVRRYGPALLHGGGSTMASVGAASLLGLAGLGATYAGYAGVGLLLAGTGWVMRRAAGLLDRLQRDSLARVVQPMWREEAFDIAFDLGLLAMLIIALPFLPGETLPERGFAPAMLIGLMRLLPRFYPGMWSDWVSDRLVLCALLAAFSFGQVLDIGVPALAALLLFTAIILPREKSTGGVSDPGGLTRA